MRAAMLDQRRNAREQFVRDGCWPLISSKWRARPAGIAQRIFERIELHQGAGRVT
jgi:hypothetical protein